MLPIISPLHPFERKEGNSLGVTRSVSERRRSSIFYNRVSAWNAAVVILTLFYSTRIAAKGGGGRTGLNWIELRQSVFFLSFFLSFFSATRKKMKKKKKRPTEARGINMIPLCSNGRCFNPTGMEWNGCVQGRKEKKKIFFRHGKFSIICSSECPTSSFLTY